MKRFLKSFWVVQIRTKVSVIQEFSERVLDEFVDVLLLYQNLYS